MNGSLPILAFDPGLIIGIVIVIIAVLGQIITKLKEMQPPPQQQRRQPQQFPPGRPAQAGGQAGAKPNPLEDEIRKFLRGAAERRGPQPQQPSAPIGPPPQAQRPEPLVTRPAEPVAVPIDAEVVDADLGGLPKDADPQKIRRLVSSFDSDVDHADDKMASHMHEVFDHRLGTLDRGPKEAAGASPEKSSTSQPQPPASLPPTAAAGVAAMFATAENVRTAILVNEILQRPEHRWE